jgi:hypothetical protein
MNWDYGYRNGEIYPGAYAYNKYHKPVLSLNHFFKISDAIQLNTAVYASFGRGGGRRIYGEQYLTFGYPDGMPTDKTFQTPDGYLDFDTVMQINQASLTGSKSVIAMSMNSHDWYGVLSTLKGNFGNFTFTAGYDGRYYKGYHYRIIDDLLGGAYYLDGSNVNRDPGTPLYKGDYVSYYNVGIVFWNGLFTQIEYSSDNFSAFVSISGSHTQYQRIDYFKYTPEEGQISDWVKFLSYSVKTGLNYNITDNFNAFANAGYFTRPPFFKFAFKGYTNEINTGADGKGIKNESILTTEAGLGYRSKYVKASIYGYYTNWMDKTLTVSMGSALANITGLNALHKGIEFVAKVRPFRKANLGLMYSMGDWRWQNDVVADIYDQDQQYLGTATVYAGGVHVSDAAQTTGAVTLDWEILPKFKIGTDWTYYDRLYAKFDPSERGSEDDKGVDAWRMPSYNLLDANLRYDFNIGSFNASLFGKINNLLDTEYFSDALDGKNHDAASSYVFYGFGRTWSLALRVKF